MSGTGPLAHLVPELVTASAAIAGAAAIVRRPAIRGGAAPAHAPASGAPDDSPRVDELSLAAALRLGPAAWDDLSRRAGERSPFMTWAWHDAWAATAAPGAAARARVLVLRAGGRIEAILPLAPRDARAREGYARTWGWALDDRGCPDHLDLLADPGADLARVASAVDRFDWDALRLANVAEEAPSLAAMLARVDAGRAIVAERPAFASPCITLPARWDDYLAARGPRNRHNLRRNERLLARDWGAEVVEHGLDDLTEGLDTLFALHERRWSGGGVFHAPGVEAMHRRFARSLAERGRLWLRTLRLRGTPTAVLYGFTHGDTVYFYQTGRDPVYEQQRVGSVLIGLTIRRAIEQGYRRFDFLRGEEGYKALWTDERRVTRELVVTRSGWRGWRPRAAGSAAAFVHGFRAVPQAPVVGLEGA